MSDSIELAQIRVINTQPQNPPILGISAPKDERSSISKTSSEESIVFEHWNTGSVIYTPFHLNSKRDFFQALICPCFVTARAAVKSGYRITASMIGLTMFYFFGLSTRIHAYTQDEAGLSEHDRKVLYGIFIVASFLPYAVYTCVIRGHIREAHSIYGSPCCDLTLSFCCLPCTVMQFADQASSPPAKIYRFSKPAYLV